MGKRSMALVASAALAAGGVVVGTQIASGAPDGTETVFVPITPCRLIDTRPNTVASPALNVGPRLGKLGADEVASFTAWGTGDGNSPCAVPVTATAIATNTVAVLPTTRSFMTLYPADVPNPGTANLNYEGGQAPTPNAANIPLATDGRFNVFNAFGEVHVVIDVNGYYQPSSAVGGSAPAGPVGPAGPAGPGGPAGASGTELFARTIIVKAGGTAAENGTRLLAAVTTVNSANPAATDPWLIKLEPGDFDIGSTQVRPERYVAIEGSGEGISTVRGAIRSNSTDAAAIIVARRTEISHLSIVNTGGPGDANFAVGIYAESGSARSVAIDVSGTQVPYGVNFSINAEFDIIDSTIDVNGTIRPRGVGNAGSANTTSVIRIIRSSITSTSSGVGPVDDSIGIASSNGTLDIDDSEITADLPVNISSSSGKAIALDLTESRLTSTDTTSPQTITVLTNGVTDARLRYVELTHFTELTDATTADCRASIGPTGFSSNGCF